MTGATTSADVQADLLEALQELVILYEATCHNLGGMMVGRAEIAKDLAKARAAIAKATGG